MNARALPPPLAERVVQPELLDGLPAHHPEAVRSRRDLIVVNAVMGNHRWLLRALRRRCASTWRVLELGAGDGALARRAWQARVRSPEQWSAVDLSPRPAGWPEASRWVQADLLADDLPDAEVVVANLVLHHLDDAGLRVLGARLPAACRLLLAAEPVRRRRHLWQGAVLCRAAAFGPVTCHDLEVSIRAGFVGDELPTRLGLGGWRWQVRETLRGAYRLEARRP